MDAVPTLKRGLSPAAQRQRLYRERQKRYARVATIEVGMEVLTVLVARGIETELDARIWLTSTPSAFRRSA